MSRLPSLGPRGEGWLAAQLALLLAVGYAPGIDPWRTWVALPAVSSVLAVAGYALAALGITIAVVAALQLSRAGAFSPLPRPRDDGALIESGLYARVRHPVYSGMALAGLGWAIAWTSPLTMAAVVGLFVVLYFKAAREEAWLATRYPGYAAYRARTKRLIPGLL
jgi:protein-S-isoprenylcysteine O-methyltransferase Ste14